MWHSSSRRRGFLTNGLERFHGCVKMDGELVAVPTLGQVVLPPSLCFLLEPFPKYMGGKGVSSVESTPKRFES